MGATANGLEVITKSAWAADNNKLINSKGDKHKVVDFSRIVEPVSLKTV